VGKERNTLSGKVDGVDGWVDVHSGGGGGVRLRNNTLLYDNIRTPRVSFYYKSDRRYEISYFMNSPAARR
jgi:hypothetical protein